MSDIEVKILGVEVGKASGWDEVDLLGLQFYDFVPLEGFSIPAGDISVHYDSGIIGLYDKEGKDIGKLRILDVIK